MDASPIDADERVGRAGNILKPASVSSQAQSGAASCTMLWHSGLSFEAEFGPPWRRLLQRGTGTPGRGTSPLPLPIWPLSQCSFFVSCCLRVCHAGVNALKLMGAHTSLLLQLYMVLLPRLPNPVTPQ